MTPAAILCDLDDTLFDHSGATRRALVGFQASVPALQRWSLDELHDRHRVILDDVHQDLLDGRRSIDGARRERFRRLMEAAGEAVTDEQADASARRYRQAYESCWAPMDGAVELLEALTRRGHAIAVVTNNLRAEQQLKLERCGLDRYVDALVTSEDAGSQKPRPEIFHQALARLDVTGADAVMFGDSWHADIAGAHAAGIRAVWFNPTALPSLDLSVVEVRSLVPVGAVVRVLTSVEDGPQG